MFGYIRANLADLTEDEKARYRSLYCGLCLALKKRHGQAARFSLTYDMTFLILLLSSLYEPEEASGQSRCAAHPAKPHAFSMNKVTDYAADMTVALTYHKCMDDWADERKSTRRLYAAALQRAYRRVKEQWPKQTLAIENGLKALAEVEVRRESSPDVAANCFGAIMQELFVMQEDYWSQALRRFGHALGRYVYLVDAACDFEEDHQKGSYNPLLLVNLQPEDLRPHLLQTLGQASAIFEAFPLVQDESILKNILYSGVWQSYNEMLERRARRHNEEREEGGERG